MLEKRDECGGLRGVGALWRAILPREFRQESQDGTAVGCAALESVPGKGDLQIMAFVVSFLFLANK